MSEQCSTVYNLHHDLRKLVCTVISFARCKLREFCGQRNNLTSVMGERPLGANYSSHFSNKLYNEVVSSALY